MKKIILCLFVGLSIFSLFYYYQNTSPSILDIDPGVSHKFTKEEISQAINRVIENFSFPACTLTKVWYDEEQSNAYVEEYLEHSTTQINTATADNIIVLLSEFHVDGSGDNPVLTPNETYTSYEWVLIRDSKTSIWEIDSWGY